MCRIHIIRLVLFLLFLSFPIKGICDGFCDSCQQNVATTEIETVSAYDGSFTRRICIWCFDSAPRCFVCKIPALKNTHRSDDKRVFCKPDFARAVFEHSEMNRLAYQTIQDLNRSFHRFNMNFAASNLTVSLVSSASLYDRAELVFIPQRADLMGLTITHCYNAEGEEVKMHERDKQPAGAQLRYEHEIYVANGFPENKLKAILAHELAHVWLHHNLSFQRAKMIDRDTIEGFCELVAYQMMEMDHSGHVRTAIRNNLYTMGQQNLLIEVESGYGFNRILQWFHRGTDRRLQHADMVRQIANLPPPAPARPAPAGTTNQTAAPVAAVAIATPEAPRPPALPETVVLKGIFYGRFKSALVNETSLSEGEERRLKLAGGIAAVKCIEIKPASVVLSVDGKTQEYAVGLPPIEIVPASGSSAAQP